MASATEGQSTGLLNLEKELICFICTEVLFQPLTLLDCLHTFCGSCLKEWFSYQHRKATSSSNPPNSTPSGNPYTCPTCRASVKDAQHNAMINTLLEMFLAANPTKDRTEEEKVDMRAIYRSGDNILPRVEGSDRRRRHRLPEEILEDRRRRREADMERDRAAVEEARERSLRDNLRPDSNRSGQNSRNERSRSNENSERRERRREQERRHRSERSHGSEENLVTENIPRSRDRRESATVSVPPTSPRHPDAVEARSRARTVAHQASLRSLVSASENDTGSSTGESITEAQLMQEILDEGLLDGINVDELTEAEQDELSEIIAERYRQLHPRRAQRLSSRDAATTATATSNMPTQESQEILSGVSNLQIEEADRHSRRTSRTSQQRSDRSPRSDVGVSDDRPLTSSSNITQTDQSLAPPSSGHRRRASDQTGRREAATRSTNAHSGTNPSPATRSATDLSDRPSSDNANATRQFNLSYRSQTEPRQPVRATEVWRQGGVDRASEQVTTPPQIDSPTMRSSVSASTTLPSSSTVTTVSQPNTTSTRPELNQSGQQSSNTSVLARFEEPSVTCSRCSKQNIQYQVYKHCDPCDMDLCQRCYRNGRGCDHWFGFGRAALVKFEASHPNTTSSQVIELPHLLVGRQYQKPPPESKIQSDSTTSTSTSLLTTSDPASRLQEGKFCDRCGNFANSCFWTCDYCNDGEWGFCNNCVNTHHCCTHPLLPLAHRSPTPQNGHQKGNDPHRSLDSQLPVHIPANMARTSPAHSQPSSAASIVDLGGPQLDYAYLSITTHCDLCSRPIPTAEARYHCPTHPSTSPETVGDYDICTDCYHNMAKVSRIKREDGPSGWRQCPDGHRMIVTAFEPDRDNNQRRVIIHDLVGGSKMTEEDITAWRRAMIQESATSSDLGAPTSPTFSNRGQWTWREDSSGNIRASRKRASTLSSNANAKFPPNGGVGKKCVALWSYYPEDGDDGKGELMFPKHAQINEAEDINEDWWFGVYAGDFGVFPRVYIREITPRLT